MPTSSLTDALAELGHCCRFKSGSIGCSCSALIVMACGSGWDLRREPCTTCRAGVAPGISSDAVSRHLKHASAHGDSSLEVNRTAVNLGALLMSGSMIRARGRSVRATCPCFRLHEQYHTLALLYSTVPGTRRTPSRTCNLHRPTPHFAKVQPEPRCRGSSNTEARALKDACEISPTRLATTRRCSAPCMGEHTYVRSRRLQFPADYSAEQPAQGHISSRCRLARSSIVDVLQAAVFSMPSF